jgi:hypothetical protein
MKHIAKPRKCDKLKPFLLIVSSESKKGKTTLSKTLNNCNDFTYYCTDIFTVDEDLPITVVNKKVLRYGETAVHNIPEFEQLILQNQNIFIDYCYKVITEDITNTIIEGVLFTHDDFLKNFKDKFNNDFKIWVVRPN